MLELDQALTKAIRDVPECIASGYVDLRTGTLLGVKTLDTHPQDVIKLIAAATADLFQGSNVAAIEHSFNQARGLKDDGRHYVQEMIIFSDNLLHVFMRGKRHQEHVVVFIARKTANLGMMLAKVRLVLPSLEFSM